MLYFTVPNYLANPKMTFLPHVARLRFVWFLKWSMLIFLIPNGGEERKEWSDWSEWITLVLSPLDRMIRIGPVNITIISSFSTHLLGWIMLCVCVCCVRAVVFIVCVCVCVCVYGHTALNRALDSWQPLRLHLGTNPVASFSPPHTQT